MIQDFLQDLRESRFFIPAIILMVGVVISAGLYLSAPEPETREVVAPTILVDAYRITKSPLTMTVDALGEVIAKTRTTLVSEVSGVITDLNENFVAGGSFQRGDLLVQMEDRNYTAEVERAKANIASAKTKLAEEEGLARYAIHDWEKSKVTAEPTDLALRKPQIAEAQAQLQFSYAELERKQGDLERTRVIAVYDGLVEERKVDVGQYVGIGTEMGVVFATDVVEVRLPIPLHEVDFLDLPDSFSDTTERLPVTLRTISRATEVTWPGEVVRTEAVMDRRNRVLYAIAEVIDPYRGYEEPLRVGSYVRATISGKSFDNVARIPRAAVRPGNKVWVVNSESQLEMRVVEPIRTDEYYLYVTDGIEHNDIVSVTALENPLPGMTVKFVLQNE